MTWSRLWEGQQTGMWKGLLNPTMDATARGSTNRPGRFPASHDISVRR